MRYWRLVGVQQPSVPAAGNPLRRLRWLFWAVALSIGILGGVLIGALRNSSSPVPQAIPTTIAPAPPDATWAAGKKLAPAFSLADENGKPVSLARYRGRPVLLTFMDPLCQDFCPLEAKVLNAVESKLPAAARPVVIAVSVNPWGNTRKTLVHDEAKWKLTSAWHWGIAAPPALKRVWAAYQIAVQPTTGHDVAHTEATFLIDRNGHQRALWLWPFRAADVARVVRRIG